MQETGIQVSAAERRDTDILRVNFEELYQRHLCRHGEPGINILHLLAVLGVYVSIYSLLTAALRIAVPGLTAESLSAVMCGLTGPYLIVLARNVRPLVLLATAISIMAVVFAALEASFWPVWLHPLLIIFWHRCQLWSHRWYPLHQDMSRFHGRYPKGWRLSVLLAVYELPILLNFLFVGNRRKSGN